jgi:hypothetical protein
MASSFRGAHARAHFGASPKCFSFEPKLSVCEVPTVRAGLASEEVRAFPDEKIKGDDSGRFLIESGIRTP